MIWLFHPKPSNYKFNIVRIKFTFSWLTQLIQKSVQFIISDGRSICSYYLWRAEIDWPQAISRLSPARLVRTLSLHNLLERVKNTRWKAPLLKPLRTNYSVRGGTCDAGPALTSHSASRKAARKCGESGCSVTSFFLQSTQSLYLLVHPSRPNKVMVISSF